MSGVTGPTPQHTVGPFFPGEFIAPWEADLTVTPGQPGRAAGQRIVIEGQVRDEATPAVNLIVELWQPDGAGIFADPRDEGYPRRDPNFRGFGRTATDQDGRYRFRTVKPGPTPGGSSGWERPPCVHLQLVGSGLMRPLGTQLFFAGEPLNATDRQWLAIPADRRERLLLGPAPGDPVDGAVRYRFDIVLRGAGETPFLSDWS